jgi:hypothetical protein
MKNDVNGNCINILEVSRAFALRQTGFGEYYAFISGNFREREFA